MGVGRARCSDNLPLLTRARAWLPCWHAGEEPPVENWVDFVSSNSSTPALPTMLAVKGEVHSQKW